MDARTAERIINEFGKVLEETSHMVYGVPESLLPYKKELIKQTIKLHLQLLSPEDDDTRNSLEIGYIHIANFIPDQDAEITAKGQAAITSGDVNHPDWRYVEPTLKIFDKITEEQKTLLKEVRSFLPES